MPCSTCLKPISPWHFKNPGFRHPIRYRRPLIHIPNKLGNIPGKKGIGNWGIPAWEGNMNRIPPLGLSLFESEVDLLSSPLLFPVCLLESPPLPPFNLEDEVGGSVIEVVTRGRPFLPRCELSNLSLSPSTKPLTLSSSATFKRPEKKCNLSLLFGSLRDFSANSFY